MMTRLLLNLAVVANIILIVICEGDKCTGTNEYFACGSACDNVCSTIRTQNKTHCPIVNIVCNRMCYCDDGYARDDKGNCIPIEKCHENPCGPNEVLTDCPVDCVSDYCPTNEKDARNKECPKPKDCPPPACKCAFNHRRTFNGSCILTRNCPSFDCSGRPNEEYNSCPPLCPTDDCSEATSSGECPYPGHIGTVLDCNPNCRCIQGYWKLNGTCVPYEQCPGV